jgi:hypothetical protein
MDVQGYVKDIRKNRLNSNLLCLCAQKGTSTGNFQMYTQLAI